MSEQENNPDIDLMRNSLQATLTNHVARSLNTDKQAHIGLLLQRGLRRYDGKLDKPTKNKLIEQIAGCNAAPEIYTKAYTRWHNITSTDQSRYAFTAAKIVGRLYTGLSSATALETGLTTHHTYGMPMLAGSSVKGAVAAYAEQIGLPENIRQVLFGYENNAGAVIWHDAWWIPDKNKPFVEEIITTHHQNYYNGQQDIDEMEKTVPNQQIATQGCFYFVVEAGNQAWANFANQLLFMTLQDQGLGSKTASGYGYFAQAPIDKIDKNNLMAYLSHLDEKTLLESLSKNRNKFLQQCQLNKDNYDDMHHLVSVIMQNETLNHYVTTWRNNTNEANKVKAVKFIDQYLK